MLTPLVGLVGISAKVFIGRPSGPGLIYVDCGKRDQFEIREK